MMFVCKCQEIEYLNAQECKKKTEKKKIVEIIQSKKTKKYMFVSIYVCVIELFHLPTTQFIGGFNLCCCQ